MAYGALEIREYSPLSSITDAGSNQRQPSWAEGLSPVSTDNNHGWVGDSDEEEDAVCSVGYKSVPAKLFTREKDHLLQIQVCWACRLEISQSPDKKGAKLAEETPSLLKLPHFAVSSWEDIAKAIHSDNGIDSSEMVFWVKQQLFQPKDSADDSTTASVSSFDALCSSSAQEYAKATDIQCSMIFPVEEACLRCRRASLLPVILDECSASRHAVRSAIFYKESALKARAAGAPLKKYVTSGQNNLPAAPSLSAPSTPFATSAAMKRHVTESPPDGRRQVVNLFNAIGLNEQNWRPRPHFSRQLRVPSYNRWSPTQPGLNTGSTEYSTPGLLAASGTSPSYRRRQVRKPGRRKMSADKSQLL